MDFSLPVFSKQNFNNLSCPGQELIDKEFSNCIFKKCDFSESNFSNTSFIDCEFVNCNLSNIKVTNCNFQGVTFEGCKLLGTRFSTIDSFLITWIFKNCGITLCDFSDLEIKDSKFLNCDLKEVDFINTDLTGSDFSGSSLLQCKFYHTNLEKTNFVEAVDYYINPVDNKVKGAQFSYPNVLGLLDCFGVKVEF